MIVEKRRFPSPSQHVRLYTICYLSNGLRVKGFWLSRRHRDNMTDFYICAAGLKAWAWFGRDGLSSLHPKGLLCLLLLQRKSRGEGNEDFAGEDREDAFSAFRLLQQHPNVKKDRIHIFGFPAAELWECSLRLKWAGMLLHSFPGRRQRYEPYI